MNSRVNYLLLMLILITRVLFLLCIHN